MVRNDYLYTICLFRADGTPLGESAIDVDWEPAVEWARFLGIRQGKLSPAAIATSAAIEPRWHPTSGQPCVNGLQVTVCQDGGVQACCEVPRTYFSPLAREASAELVEKGCLRDGEFFRYIVEAYPDGQAGPRKAPAASFEIEEVSPSLPLKPSSLADYARRSVRFAQADNHHGDMPVFMPQRVLDETASLSRKAGALETGGILIGHIHQDASLPEIFVEVTAQVPARYSRSELMRLTFTPDTWSAASASIKLRKKQEIMVGWWHSHSFDKDKKPPQGDEETNKALDGPKRDEAAFMSTEDVSLHRTCFPRAYSLALVVAEGRGTGLTWALFGWNSGMVCPRGFAVLPSADWVANENEPVSASAGEDAHA